MKLSLVLVALTALLLFVTEYFMLADASISTPSPTPWLLLAGISLLPGFFFALLTWGELTMVGRQRREGSGTLIGAYMLFKGMRLLLTVIAVAVYIYMGAPLRMMFIVNMLVLFAVVLAATSVCHLRAEQKSSPCKWK